MKKHQIGWRQLQNEEELEIRRKCATYIQERAEQGIFIDHLDASNTEDPS